MGTYSDIVEFFRVYGPGGSNVYYDHVVENGGSRGAARQRLKRALAADNRLETLSNISLPHNRQFIYLTEQRTSTNFVDRLLLELNSAQSGYATAIAGIGTRGGCVSRDDFDIITGSPIKKRAGHQLSASILESLLDEGLLDAKTRHGRKHISLPPARVEVARNYIRRKLLRAQEDLLLELLAEWLRRNGFVSYDSIDVREEGRPAEWGGYAWDLTAPSYLTSFREFVPGSKRSLAGFVVADVHARPMTYAQVAYFLKKCDAIRANARNRPFLPILMARRFSEEAYSAGRTAGYLFVTLKQFFGSKLAYRLEVVRKLYNNPLELPSISSVEIKKLLESFEQFGVSESGLRGDIFELIAYCVVARRYQDAEIEHSVKHQLNDGGEVEIDVLAKNSEEYFFLECKGYRGKKPVSLEVVEDWKDRRIPRMADYAAQDDSDTPFSSRKCHFAFWTTSVFQADALSFLREYRDTSPHVISWMDGSELEACLGEYEELNELIRMLKQHFRPIQARDSSTRAKRTGAKPPPGFGHVLEEQMNIAPGPLMGEVIKDVTAAMDAGVLSQDATCDECIQFLREESALSADE